MVAGQIMEIESGSSTDFGVAPWPESDIERWIAERIGGSAETEETEELGRSVVGTGGAWRAA